MGSKQKTFLANKMRDIFPLFAKQKAHPVETEDQQWTLSLKFGLTIKAQAKGANTDLIGDGQILALSFKDQ